MEKEKNSQQSQLKFINGRLSKYLLNGYQREQAISLFRHGKSFAEVFRIISKGKGTPKSHVSGKYKEGELKNS